MSSNFEIRLREYLAKTDAAKQPDWWLSALENSVLFTPWSDADAELTDDAKLSMRVVAHEILDAFEMDIAEAFQKCESAIERRLMLAFLIAGRHLDKLASGVDVLGKYTNVDFQRYGYDRPHLSIIPQREIVGLRVDFFLEFAQEFGRRLSNPEPSPSCAIAGMVVECDGHDFHERTKEQAAYDRARDRRLQKFGYQVFRYTGSEIYNDPFNCALNALDLLVRNVHKKRKDFDTKYPKVMDDLLD